MTPLSDDQILRALTEADAIRAGHFVLTSGRHSGTYVQCARFLEDPALTTSLAQTAVDRLPAGLNVDMVAAPAVGGLIIGFADRPGARGQVHLQRARRGRHGVPPVVRSARSGARVLVVEDVVTTGGSVGEVVDLVRFAGGEVVGVVSIIDRGGDRKFTAPFWPLLSLEVESWDASECVLCADGLPVTSPGSRRISS